jgi:hypothetical protein
MKKRVDNVHVTFSKISYRKWFFEFQLPKIGKLWNLEL